MKKLLVAALAGLSMAMSLSVASAADDKKVVIAYQTGSVPYFVGIANGDFAKKTGWDIEFRRFNSGAEIFAAIASGDVQIGDVGSSPFAAAVSRGVDVKGFFISFVSGDGEALVVRPDIQTPADLKGKKLAAAPVSTDHYQLLAVLKQEGISEQDAQVIAIPQPEIVAAWKRGDIDGAFVWDPALTELKKDGKVLLTSGQVAERGAPTFSAIVATGPFLKEHPEFITQYADLVDGYFRSYASDTAAWGVDSENVKLISNLQGGTPANVFEQLKATIGVPPLEEQTSDKWLGGGENSGVAKILKDTAYFLKDQKKITAVKDSYAEFADPQYAEAAKALSN
ncbi:ABC transporter substrate-binding protein [Mesorhizobium sp. LHD-90]|uniref:taurine ABC transporter substrate-binding protein n=1 Tax=Mesorhizobium sp. LHD-90 TaxID=3071414 RepID=UPI0027DFA4C2|nr:ABC transporter substrate-binding protein [Mesorhizobium sp. LHD-90]MDQ6436798.1 ABC transporter substrate-binding protein [Mesorhizobium sp. LHD-90]